MSLNKHHNWKFDDRGIRSNPAGGAVRVNDFRTADRNVPGDLSDDELNTEVARLIKVAEERKRDKHRGHHLPDAPQSAAERMSDPTIDRRYLGMPEAAEQAANAEETRMIQEAVFGKRAKIVQEELIGDFARALLKAHVTRGGHPSQFAEQRVNIDLLKRELSSTSNSGADGGHLLPLGYIQYLFKEPAPLQNLHGSCFTLPVTTLSGKAPTATGRPQISYDGENVAITEDEPSFGKTEYTVRRRGVRVIIPKELADDSAPAIVEVVRQLIMEALWDERERSLAVGSGSGDGGYGFYHATSITDVSGVTSISYATLNKLFYSVDQRYRVESAWTMNSMVRKAIDGLTDLNGRPLISNAISGIDGPTPERLLGRPVVVCDHFPNSYIGFGRLKGMTIFDRGLMSLDVSDQAGDAFEKFQLVLRLVERQYHNYVNPSSAVQFARSRVLTGIS